MRRRGVSEILRVYKEIEGKKMNAVVKRTPAEWKSFFESEEFVENFTYEGDDPRCLGEEEQGM